MLAKIGLDEMQQAHGAKQIHQYGAAFEGKDTKSNLEPNIMGLVPDAEHRYVRKPRDICVT